MVQDPLQKTHNFQRADSFHVNLKLMRALKCTTLFTLHTSFDNKWLNYCNLYEQVAQCTRLLRQSLFLNIIATFHFHLQFFSSNTMKSPYYIHFHFVGVIFRTTNTRKRRLLWLFICLASKSRTYGTHKTIWHRALHVWHVSYLI